MNQTPEEYLRNEVTTNVHRLRDDLVRLQEFIPKLGGFDVDNISEERLASVADIVKKAGESSTWLGLMCTVITAFGKERV